MPADVEAIRAVELGVIIGKRGRDIPASKALDYVAGYVRRLIPLVKPFVTLNVSLQTLAIDYTARNVQDAVKAKGLPWSAAKVRRSSLVSSAHARYPQARLIESIFLAAQGFDTFCPVGQFIPKDKVQDPHNLRLWYKVRSASLTFSYFLALLMFSCLPSLSLHPLSAPEPPSTLNTPKLSHSQINDSTKQDDSTSLMLYRIPDLIAHVSGIMTLEEGDLLLTGPSPPSLSPSSCLPLFGADAG